MTDEEIAAHVRKVVDEAPPLSPSIRATITALFAPVVVRRLAKRASAAKPDAGERAA